MKPSDKHPQIAVIGDAGQFADTHKRKLARETGALLAANGFRVVTGGMGGVMAEACAGAMSVAERPPAATVGIVPQSDKSRANQWLELALPTNMEHGRNQLVALSDAVIAIGGGAGTLNEAAFAWMHNRLIIALRCDGWSGEIAGRRLDGRIRFPDIGDDKIHAADTPQEALDILVERLPLYRRRTQPSVEKLNKTFAAMQITARRARKKTQGGLACFIRHSIRYNRGGMEGVPLTLAGEQAAWVLGRCLPENKAAAILHTSSYRAKQTAEHIAAGCEFAGTAREDALMADFCYVDKPAAREMRRARTLPFLNPQTGQDEGFVAALSNPSFAPMHPFGNPDDGVVFLAAAMLKMADGGLCVGVSHDWLVQIAAMRALGCEFESKYQADFLDAAFFWVEDGRLHIGYKDEEKPCCDNLQAAFLRLQKNGEIRI